MPQPHKHAALIKAWADGAEIQFWNGGKNSDWEDCEEGFPFTYTDDYAHYRIKPEPKPDVVFVEHYSLGQGPNAFALRDKPNGTKVQFTFDGETHKLKDVCIVP